MAGYEAVIGLEVHVQIKTASKMFCKCPNHYGAEPNTNVCPVCMGHPGVLPNPNREAIRKTVAAGLMTSCRIPNRSKFDRKSYFYPDMPKNYQLTQYDMPFCLAGKIHIHGKGFSGEEMADKYIGLTRIHLEEDVAKSTHFGDCTGVDFNRAGVPLMEIVSEPDMRSADEAYAYLTALKQIMQYGGIGDCDMEKGQMRCDVNISLRPVGQKEFGTKIELKNLNSFRAAHRAVEYEIKRQIIMLEAGEEIEQETRGWNDDAGESYLMRGKENANDYRYFPEPDILRFYISPESVEEIRKSLPELPDAKLKRYVEDMKLPENNARLIYKYRNVTEFFDSAVKEGASASNVLNLIIGTIYATLQTEEDKENFEIKTTAKQMAELVKLIDDKKIRANKAKEVLAEMLESGKDVSEYIKADDLKGMSDDDLKVLCQGAIDANPKAVEDIKNGKDKAINVMFGYVMKNSKGKADVGKASQIIKEIIANM